MAQISPVELFIALFIGMGPIKVLLIYIAMTEGMSREVRRQIARRTVMVAGAVGIVLFIFGALLQAVLHFSIGALTIVGGLILLILALTMVLGGGSSSSASSFFWSRLFLYMLDTELKGLLINLQYLLRNDFFHRL